MAVTVAWPPLVAVKWATEAELEARTQVAKLREELRLERKARLASRCQGSCVRKTEKADNQGDALACHFARTRGCEVPHPGVSHVLTTPTGVPRPGTSQTPLRMMTRTRGGRGKGCTRRATRTSRGARSSDSAAGRGNQSGEVTAHLLAERTSFTLMRGVLLPN